MDGWNRLLFLSTGFILYEDNEPVLGYTGDSGFNRTLYDQLFAAPNVVIDARTDSTYEHAGVSNQELLF